MVEWPIFSCTGAAGTSSPLLHESLLWGASAKVRRDQTGGWRTKLIHCQPVPLQIEECFPNLIKTILLTILPATKFDMLGLKWRLRMVPSKYFQSIWLETALNIATRTKLKWQIQNQVLDKIHNSVMIWAEKLLMVVQPKKLDFNFWLSSLCYDVRNVYTFESKFQVILL